MTKTAVDQSTRSEIGRRRRERTRATIVDTALLLMRERGAEEPMLDEFITAAGVAKGTFYNHFRTKSELLSALGAYVADAVDEQISLLFTHIDDPAQRIAIACRVFIRLCRAHPEWGWILVRSIPSARSGWSEGMRRGVLSDIRNGVKSGIFDVPCVPVAAAVGLGGLAMAIQSTLVGATPVKLGEAVAEMTLRGLGMNRDDARRIANLPLPPAH